MILNSSLANYIFYLLFFMPCTGRYGAYSLCPACLFLCPFVYLSVCPLKKKQQKTKTKTPLVNLLIESATVFIFYNYIFRGKTLPLLLRSPVMVKVKYQGQVFFFFFNGRFGGLCCILAFFIFPSIFCKLKISMKEKNLSTHK